MKRLIKAVPLLLLLIAGCESNQSDFRQGEVLVSLDISTSSGGTRAASEGECRLNSLQLLTFDANGECVYYYRPENPGAVPSFKLVKGGTYTVYVAANIPSDLSGVASEDEFRARRVSYLDESGTNMQMMGSVTAMITDNCSLHVDLKRFAAKYRFHGYKLRPACTNNCSKTVKSATMMAVPRYCYYDYSECGDNYLNLTNSDLQQDGLFHSYNNSEQDNNGWISDSGEVVFYGYPNSNQTVGNFRYPRILLTVSGEYYNKGVFKVCNHSLIISLPPVEPNKEYNIVNIVARDYVTTIPMPGDNPIAPGDWVLPSFAQGEPFVEVRDMTTGELERIEMLKEVQFCENE